MGIFPSTFHPSVEMVRILPQVFQKGKYVTNRPDSCPACFIFKRLFKVRSKCLITSLQESWNAILTGYSGWISGGGNRHFARCLSQHPGRVWNNFTHGLMSFLGGLFPVPGAKIPMYFSRVIWTRLAQVAGRWRFSTGYGKTQKKILREFEMDQRISEKLPIFSKLFPWQRYLALYMNTPGLTGWPLNWPSQRWNGSVVWKIRVPQRS